MTLNGRKAGFCSQLHALSPNEQVKRIVIRGRARGAGVAFPLCACVARDTLLGRR